MKHRVIIPAIAAIAFALSASAQEQASPAAAPGNGVENIIVTAPKQRPEKALTEFIIGHTAPSPLLGKIARWKTGICPLTIGLPAKFNFYIDQRILRVATTAGAPLAPSEPCRPNVLVLATPEPQKLLDYIREKRKALLGFHYRPQTRRIATMTLPVQAWYSTATEDFRGFVSADLPSGSLGYGVMSANGEIAGYNTSGSRTGDGLKSEFTTAIIIVDTGKIGGQEIGPLADYIAMLALSQGQYYDTCQEIPTITNLMAPGCSGDSKPAGLTDIDAAYLRGLYKMNAGTSFLGQRGSIAFEMKKDLGGY
jgi:hypothetical protein